MKKLVKTNRIMQIWGVTRQTILMWRKEGMPYTGSKKSLRYDLDAVVEWHKHRDSADKVKAVNPEEKINEIYSDKK